ncbi:hypothetical protein ACWGN5_35105 [Streptomyces sp. NPDC055815]
MGRGLPLPLGRRRRPRRPRAAIVAGLGGIPESLARDAEHARAAGATELRLYHAGLASDEDLAAVRTALRTVS